MRESGSGRELAVDGFTGSRKGAGVPEEVSVARKGSGSGRGGYVCPDLKCLDAALQRKTLLRRLKATSESPDLREEFERLINVRQRQE